MFDINKPVTNPDLVKAINDSYPNQIDKQKHIILEARKARLLAPVLISPEPEGEINVNERVIKKDTTISFNLIEDTNNQKYFIAFTDWNALRKWRNIEKQQTIVTSFDDLSSMVLNSHDGHSGFVINPYGEDIVFRRSLLEALHEEQNMPIINSTNEYVVKKDSKVMLGQPRVFPQDLVDAITRYLENQKMVRAAYFMQMLREEELSYLLIIDFSGNKKVLFGGISKSVQGYLNGMNIDMMPLETGFAQEAIRNVKPFYMRKRPSMF